MPTLGGQPPRTAAPSAQPSHSYDTARVADRLLLIDGARFRRVEPAGLHHLSGCSRFVEGHVRAAGEQQRARRKPLTRRPDFRHWWYRLRYRPQRSTIFTPHRQLRQSADYSGRLIAAQRPQEPLPELLKTGHDAIDARSAAARTAVQAAWQLQRLR